MLRKEAVQSKILSVAKKEKLLAITWNLSNFSYRNVLYKHYSEKFDLKNQTKVAPEHYLQKISNSKFFPSPQGYGLECYRTWEILAMGGIPIVERRRFRGIYDHLPLLLVDNLFTDVNPKMLKEQWKRLTDYKQKYKFQKLFIPYYQKEILKSIQ